VSSGSGLERFVAAQDPVYARVLAELRAGGKRSHWMWFVFPQIAGLGHSDMARRYAIAGLAEAKDYLAEPVLGPRLRECTQAMLDWAGKRSADQILGSIDALKFASSMTLFEAAGGSAEFGKALDAFYNGRRDARTLDIIAQP
jgi:uncharacterized protein (DUF1810 family)